MNAKLLIGQPALVGFCLLAGCAPQRSPLVPRSPQGIFHVVKAGETLFRIGKAYDITYEELARVNHVKDPNRIWVGQRLFIPGAIRQLPVDVIAPMEPAAETAAPPAVVDPSGEAFLWPVSGTINSGFGPRGTSFHDGVDIAAPQGTPIRAVDNGEVIYSDELRGYGNIVIIRHGGGFVSVYAHNETNLVREGQIVSRGDTIALVGITGRVTGPHLHFEIRKDNLAQDPARYFPQLCCLPSSDNSRPSS